MSDAAKLAEAVERAMRSIQVADDELARRRGDGKNLEFVRQLIQTSQEHCADAIALILALAD